LEWDALSKGALKTDVEKKILDGKITKRSELASIVNSGGLLKANRKSADKPILPRGVSANAFLKAMTSKSKDLNLDKKTQDLLRALVEETKEMMGSTTLKKDKYGESTVKQEMKEVIEVEDIQEPHVDFILNSKNTKTRTIFIKIYAVMN
jgi:hypothetical protein